MLTGFPNKLIIGMPLRFRKACGTSFSIQGNHGSGFLETAMMHDTMVSSKFANFSQSFFVCLVVGVLRQQRSFWLNKAVHCRTIQAQMTKQLQNYMRGKKSLRFEERVFIAHSTCRKNLDSI